MTAIAEPIPKRSDVGKIARNAALRYQGHEGMMLEKIMRQNRIAEKIADQTARGVLGQESLTLTKEEAEEMAVNIGNEFHYHMPQAETKAEVVKPEVVKPEIVQPVVAPVANGANKLLPIALMLATLGAGGIGAGALALWQRWTEKPTVVQPIAPQDWKLGVEVSDQP